MTSATTTRWICDCCGVDATGAGEAMPAGWMSFNGAVSRGRGVGERGEIDLCGDCADAVLVAIGAMDRPPTDIERAS